MKEKIMRRNDVVWLKNDPEALWSFYGRIIRIIGDKALWIDCGKYIHLTPLDKLEVVNYLGKWEWGIQDDGMIHYYHKDEYGFPDSSKLKFKRLPRFERMPTLRKLKQMASRYAKRNVWKTSLDWDCLQVDE